METVMSEELTYEQARKELADIVQKLESGGIALAESMALWERGEKLVEVCTKFLDAAEAKVALASEAKNTKTAQ